METIIIRNRQPVRKRVKRNGIITAVSRLIIQEHLGRVLSSNEVVHHIDGSTLNDNINNLKLLSREKHSSEHRLGHTARPRKISNNLNEAWCSTCKQFLDKSNFTIGRYHWNKLDPRCKSCKKIHERKYYMRKLK